MPHFPSMMVDGHQLTCVNAIVALHYFVLCVAGTSCRVNSESTRDGNVCKFTRVNKSA